MRIITIGELCARLRSNPLPALGARSPTTLLAYLDGYATAVTHHGVAQMVDEVGPRFFGWATSQVELTLEHRSRLNAMSVFSPSSLALLASEDEHDAFEAWIDLRSRCIAELGEDRVLDEGYPGDRTLFGMLAPIRERPGMFFGSGHIEPCWAVINGYLDAEREHGVASVDAAKLRRFQPWVDARYPFGRGHDWFRVYRLLALDPNRGFETFFRDLDLFLGGAPPDAPDPGMTAMLEAIRAHAGRGEPR